MYHIEYDRQASLFLRRAPRKIVAIIKLKLEQLSENPLSAHSNVKLLQGSSRDYRIRIGKIRVVYTPDTNAQTLIVWKIAFRGSVYKP